MDILNKVKDRYPYEPQFYQAVKDVFLSLGQTLDENKLYQDMKIAERLIEPDRILQFRVVWHNDKGEMQVNRGWRVQYSNAIGPYKGGLRFHPSVTLDTFKFLGFEQTFKNALTDLQMGGAKGGADFNPKGKSDAEILRFCHAFMGELYRHIGPDTDIPAGDIGAGEREIGYLFGAYKKLTGRFDGAMTGKNPAYGGSCIRKEATGFGCVYFLEHALNHHDEELKDKKCALSGAGNVALFTAKKLIEKGAIVISLSDSGGMIHMPDGITEKNLKKIIEIKEENYGTLEDYAKTNKNCNFHPQKQPWSLKCDIAIPCAVQNEIDKDEAKLLKDNNVPWICEAANMPLTHDATKLLQEKKTIILPSKAVNAGGVAVSGLERTQNAQYLGWARNKVDQHLKDIMRNIHDLCVEEGTSKQDGSVNYIDGANIAGFKRVANAMMAYGTL